MWRYLYWKLWQHKLVVSAVIGYFCIYAIDPAFAVFSLNVLPVMLLSASTTLSVQILLRHKKAKVGQIWKTLLLSASVFSLTALAVLYGVDALHVGIFRSVPIAVSVLAVYLSILAGIVLGVAETLLHNFFGKPS